MRKGQKAKIVCPPEYAFGEAGNPPLIGPGTTVTFEVELLDFSFSVPADYSIAHYSTAEDTDKNAEDQMDCGKDNSKTLQPKVLRRATTIKETYKQPEA